VSRVVATILGGLLFGLGVGGLVGQFLVRNPPEDTDFKGLVMGLGVGLLLAARWLPDKRG